MSRKISALIVAFFLPIVLLWLLQVGIGQAQPIQMPTNNIIFTQWNFEDLTTTQQFPQLT